MSNKIKTATRNATRKATDNDTWYVTRKATDNATWYVT